MRPQGLTPMVLGPVDTLGVSGILSPALLSFYHLFLLPIPCHLQPRSYLQTMYLRHPGLMELELRKWLPTSSPNKIVYPFPKHSQSAVFVCVCKSEESQDMSPGANLKGYWGSGGAAGNGSSKGQDCPQR